MRTIRLRKVWLRAHRFQSHQLHQSTHPLAVDHPSLISKKPDQLPGTKVRLIGMGFVDGLHQRQVLR